MSIPSKLHYVATPTYQIIRVFCVSIFIGTGNSHFIVISTGFNELQELRKPYPQQTHPHITPTGFKWTAGIKKTSQTTDTPTTNTPQNNLPEKKDGPPH